jgi:hypothetical protein
MIIGHKSNPQFLNRTQNSAAALSVAKISSTIRIPLKFKYNPYDKLNGQTNTR